MNADELKEFLSPEIYPCSKCGTIYLTPFESSRCEMADIKLQELRDKDRLEEERLQREEADGLKKVLEENLV